MNSFERTLILKTNYNHRWEVVVKDAGHVTPRWISPEHLPLLMGHRGPLFKDTLK